MNKPVKYCYILILNVSIVLLAFNRCHAQDQRPLLNAHSHNDYSQSDPFYHAYKNGFESIEADVFLVHNKLYVSHDKDKIQHDRSLKKLYIKPIKKALKRDTGRTLILLVDIKGDAHTTLVRLIKELKPLHKLISGYDPHGRLTILISGNRPLPAAFDNYPKYLYFDEDLVHTYSKSELQRIGQISLRYSNYSKWKGLGQLPELEKKILKNVIDSVHALGKPIRFWDAPDNPAGWKSLLELHTDMIGTDKIDELSLYLSQEENLTPPPLPGQ